MKSNHRECVLLAVVTVALGACHKQDPVEELEKAAVAIEKMEKDPAAKGGENDGDFDPSKSLASHRIRPKNSMFRAFPHIKYAVKAKWAWNDDEKVSKYAFFTADSCGMLVLPNTLLRRNS